MEPNLSLILASSIIVIVLFVLILLLSKFYNRSVEFKRRAAELEDKYSNIVNVDKEIESKLKNFSEEEIRIQNQILEIRDSLSELKDKYQGASEIYEKLNKENDLLRDNLDISEFGIYEPHFEFETSELFKEVINEVREELKLLIKNDDAIYGGAGWTVNNSVQKGRTMIKRQKKLMLRAFNGECDNFISSVTWSNVQRMEERINKSSIAISKMGETQGLNISSAYSELKHKELRLTHEYRQKKYEEKEIQRLIKEEMREEEKARRDFEKAQKEAEKEEKLLLQAMKKAQAEISKASEEERANFESQLESLKAQLKIAEEKNQRAISMAQQTKSGHVYVISNIGSFGENIYKIGMTRRLEPLDRVNELGDASVPFKFDVHAMIFSENAPELEKNLHRAFENQRLNYVNRRREYFKLPLADIESIVKENHGEIEFIIEPEAKEYRESIILREKLLTKETPVEKERQFPKTEEIFG